MDTSEQQRAAALCEKLEGYDFQSKTGSLKDCIEWQELLRIISGTGNNAADLRDDPPPLSR
jgi:hypothetical protein